MQLRNLYDVLAETSYVIASSKKKFARASYYEETVKNAVIDLDTYDIALPGECVDGRTCQWFDRMEMRWRSPEPFTVNLDPTTAPYRKLKVS